MQSVDSYNNNIGLVTYLPFQNIFPEQQEAGIPQFCLFHTLCFATALHTGKYKQEIQHVPMFLQKLRLGKMFRYTFCRMYFTQR